MMDNSQRQRGRGRGLSALNMTIDSLNLAKEATSTTPASPIIGSVATLLTMIRVCPFPFREEVLQAHTCQDTMANKQDYIDLGLSCANICKALERGMDGRELDELSKSVRDAIDELKAWVELAKHIFCSPTHHDHDCRTVAEIHEEVKKRSEQHGVFRFLHSRDDKAAIPGWNSKLDRILHVFNVC